MTMTIHDNTLTQRLRKLAEQQDQSVEELLYRLIEQVDLPKQSNDMPSAEELARQVHLNVYQKARDYWLAHGNEAKAALSDEEMDEQFWVFDSEGIPRLKSEKQDVSIPKHSLYRAGEVFHQAGFRSGHHDIAERSKDILNNEFADYLLNNREQHDSSDAR